MWGYAERDWLVPYVSSFTCGKRDDTQLFPWPWPFFMGGNWTDSFHSGHCWPLLRKALFLYVILNRDLKKKCNLSKLHVTALQEGWKQSANLRGEAWCVLETARPEWWSRTTENSGKRHERIGALVREDSVVFNIILVLTSQGDKNNLVSVKIGFQGVRLEQR